MCVCVCACPLREWATFEEEEQVQQQPSVLLQYKVCVCVLLLMMLCSVTADLNRNTQPRVLCLTHLSHYHTGCCGTVVLHTYKFLCTRLTVALCFALSHIVLLCCAVLC